MLLTCHVTGVLVPPESPAWNCRLVATLTETMEGEMATLIPVTGSLQAAEEVDVVDEVVVPFVVFVEEVVVVHTMAVLEVVLLPPPHEARLNMPMSNANIGRRFTAPLSLTLNMPMDCGSVGNYAPKSANYIGSCL